MTKDSSIEAQDTETSHTDCDGDLRSELMPSGCYRQSCPDCGWWAYVG